jgi:regulator of sigma D
MENPSASSDEEKAVVDKFVTTVTEEIAKNNLRDRFKNYKDKSNLISQAISCPNEPEKKELAKNECHENVKFCQTLVNLAKTNGECVKEMYKFIIEKSEGSGLIHTIEQYPLLAKTLAQAIDFAMDFDAIKLTLFKITGDISYYRRCISPADIDEFASVGTTGQFFGYPAPFVMSIYNSLDNEKEKIMNFFGSYCDVFTSLLDGEEGLSEDVRKLLVRAIGGLFIIIDNVAPSGAFCSVKFFSNVDAARIISTFTPKQNDVMAAVVYNSQNFSKPTTLPKISEYLRI